MANMIAFPSGPPATYSQFQRCSEQNRSPVQLLEIIAITKNTRPSNHESSRRDAVVHNHGARIDIAKTAGTGRRILLHQTEPDHIPSQFRTGSLVQLRSQLLIDEA